MKQSWVINVVEDGSASEESIQPSKSIFRRCKKPDCLSILYPQSGREKHAAFHHSVPEVKFNLIKGLSVPLGIHRVVQEYHQFGSLIGQNINLPGLSQHHVSVLEIKELQYEGAWWATRRAKCRRHPMHPLYHKVGQK